MKVMKISPRKSQTYYPDIDDNLSLPESERFAIEMQRPSRHDLFLHSVTTIIDEDGNTQQVTDNVGYTLAHVKRLINAPVLDFGDKRRPMVPADLFNYDEFLDIATEVMNRSNGMHGVDSGEPEAKNS